MKPAPKNLKASWTKTFVQFLDRLLFTSFKKDTEEVINLATFREIEQSPQEQYHTNVIIIISSVTFIVAIILLVYFFIGIVFNIFDDVFNRFITLFAIPSIYLLFNFWVYKKTHQNKIQVITSVIISTSFIAIIFATYFTGGLYAPTILGLIVVLVAATLLTDYYSTFLLYSIILVYFFFLFYAHTNNYLPTIVQDLTLQIIALVIAITSLVLIIAYHRYAIQESEHKVAQLEADLKYFEAQREITRNLTHDLRTPLSVVKSTAYIISKKQERDLPIDDQVDKLNRTSEHMNLIIDSLFELTQLDSEMRLSTTYEVNVKSLIRDSISKLEPYALENNIKMLIVDNIIEPIYIIGSTIQLSRALIELIENAIHHSDTKEKISVVLKQDSDHIYISVVDDGIGISPEYHEQLFNRFFKVDAARTTSQKVGTGIGLTIAKKIIELHKGYIELHSQIGEGATFTVVLPISKKII